MEKQSEKPRQSTSRPVAKKVVYLSRKKRQHDAPAYKSTGCKITAYKPSKKRIKLNQPTNRDARSGAARDPTASQPTCRDAQKKEKRKKGKKKVVVDWPI